MQIANQARVRVKPGSKWICWIEMNLSGDYTGHYPEYNEINKKTDNYGTGQPALVYKAYIEAVEGNIVVTEIVGMSVLNKEEEIIQPLEDFTTAKDVFEEITIVVLKPKPKVCKTIFYDWKLCRGPCLSLKELI